MKKTLIALSVLAMAGTANAGITLYDQDSVTVDMGGDIEVLYYKGTAEDSSVEQQIEDADVKFDVRYAIDDEYSVGAYWEFQGDADGAGDSGNTTSGVDSSMGDVYVALYTASMGSLKVGDLCNIADDLGVGSDFQFGISDYAEDNVGACGDETIRYDYSSDAFYVSAAFRDDQRTDATTDLADIKAGVIVAGLDLMAYYGTSNSADLDAYAFEASYTIDAVKLEVGYFSTEDVEDTLGLAATYKADAWQYAAGVNFVDEDDSAKEDTTNYFVNVGYGIAPGSTVYAEIGGTDADDSELGYAVGAKVEF